MKSTWTIFALLGLLPATAVPAADRVELRTDAAEALHRIDERIHGHFLEHIFHSVNGGLWGELVWNRSFELNQADDMDVPDGNASIRNWRGYGSGAIAVDTDHPLNSRFSVRIAGDAGESGLAQDGFALRAGARYAGSLWMRGQAADGLVVRFVQDDEILAEAKLEPPRMFWDERSFTLEVPRDAGAAVLQVGVCGQAEVWIDQVSLMPEAWASEGGFRPDLLQAVRDLRPPVIRWPGGCYASAYRWKDGIGPQHQRRVPPIEMWDDRDVNAMGTDEFIDLCRRVGAEPVIVVNIGAPDWRLRPSAWRAPEEEAAYLQDLLDWIEYCNGPASSRWGRVRAAHGHPEPYNVKYWEIDNETWHMGPARYAGVVNRIAPLMRRVDPSIRIIACGSAGYGPQGAGQRWNRILLEHCAAAIDYLSLHHYEPAEEFAEGPARYEAFFRETGELIRQSANPEVKLYISEWNAQSTDWRTGLYAGGLLNAFERCGDMLTMAGPALLLRHVSAREWDNAFINFDQRTWFPAPNYVVMRLWRDHFAPTRLGLQGDPAGLNAVATRSEDETRVYLKIVNPGDQPRDVAWTLDHFPLGTAVMKLVTAEDLSARNTLDEPQAIQPVTGAVKVTENTVTFRLPRWSAAVIDVRRR
jgi:alpha-L-arabinofuranosidase